jgi:hypothetical protein
MSTQLRKGAHTPELLAALTCLSIAAWGCNAGPHDKAMTPPSSVPDAGAVGAGGDAGGDATVSAPTVQSFEVDVIMTWASFGNPDVSPDLFPTRQRFTVTLDLRTPGSETLIIGGRGLSAAVPVSVDPSGKVAFVNDDPALQDQQMTSLEVAFDPPGQTGCAGIDAASYTSLDLQISGERLMGHAYGFARYSGGDYVGRRTFGATLSGTRDVSGPSLSPSLAPEITADPFDGFFIGFNEALPTGVQARLIDGVTSYPLQPSPATFPSIFSPRDTLMPFGRRLGFQLDSPLRDLAGNTAVAPRLVVVTPDLAGPFAGFEGSIAANVSGRTRIVDDKVIPALAGKHGLVMDAGPYSESLAAFPGGRFTARLPIPAGASTIVVGVRTLAPAGGGYPPVQARAGTIGGAVDQWSFDLLFLDESAAVPSGFADFPWLGPATTQRHPLPPGTKNEVVLDLSTRVGGCGGLIPPLGAVVIQSITVE